MSSKLQRFLEVVKICVGTSKKSLGNCQGAMSRFQLFDKFLKDLKLLQAEEELETFE
jgi:hypothetical protein